MILASLICECEDKLICDFQQYYTIADIYGLEVSRAAILAAGLPAGSRSIMHLSGQTADNNTLLLAMAVDALNINNWMRSKDGAKNRNRPKSIVRQLLAQKEKDNDVQGFSDPVEFEKAKDRIIRRARTSGSKEEVRTNGNRAW
jgi:hypothetical protein